MCMTDFDQTISRYWTTGAEGKCRVVPTHGVLLASDLIPEEYKKRTKALLNKYYPIEIDGSLSREAKTPLMEEWWRGAQDLFSEYGFSIDLVRRALTSAPFEFRSG